jgi:hypothetical protein
LGGVSGAFIVAFFLLDDYSHKPPSIAAVPIVASSIPKSQPVAAQVMPKSEPKPVGVTAEAVDPNSLPSSQGQGQVLSTVRRDDTSIDSTTSVQ